MEEYSKEGHRQRMRDTYLKTGTQGMTDTKLLELYLSLIIPRKDVRELSYELMNRFGSLESVFSAEVDELMEVKGIGENTAVLMTLFREIKARIDAGKNSDVVELKSISNMVDYARNALGSSTKEEMLLISLDNSNRIISSEIALVGGVNFIDADPKRLLKRILADNASGVVIAHSHPKGSATPSASDINFTIRLASLLCSLRIDFIDHIIIGEGEHFSMRSNKSHSDYLIGVNK